MSLKGPQLSLAETVFKNACVLERSYLLRMSRTFSILFTKLQNITMRFCYFSTIKLKYIPAAKKDG